MMDAFVARLESFFRSDAPEKFPTLFFRIYQILSALSLISVASLLSSGTFALVGVGSAGFLILSGFAWSLVSLVAAEVGIRCVQKQSILGFWIGISLSLALVVTLGVSILLGFFGLFAFLNPPSQNMFLKNPPEWLQKTLSSLHINFLHQ